MTVITEEDARTYRTFLLEEVEWEPGTHGLLEVDPAYVPMTLEILETLPVEISLIPREEAESYGYDMAFEHISWEVPA